MSTKYVNVYCVQKGWTSYKQIHLMIPNLYWTEDGLEDSRIFTYWSVVPKCVMEELEDNPIFKSFFMHADVSKVFDYFIITIDSIVDGLPQLKDNLISGEEMMALLSNRYAVVIKDNEFKSLYYIGKCYNFWDVPISQIMVHDNHKSLTTIRATLTSGNDFRFSAKLLRPTIGKELWDKLIHWVCIECVQDEMAPPPIKLHCDVMSTGSMDMLLSAVLRTEECDKLPAELTESIKSEVQVVHSARAEFYEQFGLKSEKE